MQLVLTRPKAADRLLYEGNDKPLDNGLMLRPEVEFIDFEVDEIEISPTAT